MRERPDGADLLAIAREVLKNELLPLLPKERNADALMIANALGIAERQLRHGDAPAREEQKALAELLRQHGTLPELNQAFARAIRAGEMDDNSRAHELLWEATLARVRESAPRALAAWSQG